MVKLAKLIFRTVRWYLSKLWLRLWPDIDIIGVAGSVGKTTTKEMISSVLSTQYKTAKTDANWDPIFNIPISSFKAWGSSKFVVELGVDGVGQMDKYLSLVDPRIGVLTRLSLEHTDENHLKSLEIAIAEEIKVIQSLPSYGWAVVNGDDPEILKHSNKTKAQWLTYGFGENNDVRITNFSQSISSRGAEVEFTIKYDHGELRVSTNLLGRINALNSAAAVCVGIITGMSHEDIQKGLGAMKPIKGRLAVSKTPFGFVIDDTYNASPAAAKAAIDVLADVVKGKSIFALGDMLELGKYSKEAHREVGEYAKDSGIDVLIAYGDFSNDVVEGFDGSNNSYVATNHEEVVSKIKSEENSTILVKGSRGMRMERVVEALTKLS